MQEVFIEVSKAVFAICDSESMYIYNLMEYVHSRKSMMRSTANGLMQTFLSSRWTGSMRFLPVLIL